MPHSMSRSVGTSASVPQINSAQAISTTITPALFEQSVANDPNERCTIDTHLRVDLFKKYPIDDASFLTVSDVLTKLGPTTASAGYIVDFGAGVRDSDPCFPLFDAGYRGLMVDGEPTQEAKMRHRFRKNPTVQQRIALLSATNVAKILRAANAPRQPELLKMDIDGFDCNIMDAVLAAGFRPKVVVMEVNVGWPPPVRFSLSAAANYDSEKRGFMYGCSLSYQADLMAGYGYTLLQLDWNNALYVQRELSHHFDHHFHRKGGNNTKVCAAFLRGFAERAGVYETFPFWAPRHIPGSQQPYVPYGGVSHRDVSQWRPARMLTVVARNIAKDVHLYAGRSFVLATHPVVTRKVRARTTWTLETNGSFVLAHERAV